jgi:bacillithiol biosynthesis cysteine-adding enzyme BshC
MNPSMESHCLSFRDVPHTTEIFSTFLEDFKRVSAYFGHPPTESGVTASAGEVRLDPAIRSGVVEVLREQNRLFGADPSTTRSLDRLASGAVAIVTGQQVGLFGGPAFSFYKAITAVCWAEEMSRRGIEAVPIFWLATEDHDLAEVNHSFWNTRNGLARYELPARDEDAGHRVGEVTLGSAVSGLVAQAAETLEGASAGEIARALRESYTPNETYGTAFGKLMARLLAGRGIIFIDPLDARLHRLAAPVYRGALDAATELRDVLVARSKELETSSFHAQVKVTGVSTLLFYDINGQRTPLRSHNGGFSAGDVSFTAEELRAAIDKKPEAFSPNALLRPVIQDSLLPTAAYIGGPAEIAYLAQSNVVYKKLLGRMPAMLPRESFTLIEPGIARILQKFELGLPDLFEGQQVVRTKLERKALPGGLAQRFDSGEAALRELLETYRAPLKEFDPTLLGTLDAVNEKMLYQFLKLKGKVGEAQNLRSGVLDRKERLLLDSLYPNHALQERSLSLLPFLATYGTALLDEVARFCGPTVASQHAPQHHILFL